MVVEDDEGRSQTVLGVFSLKAKGKDLGVGNPGGTPALMVGQGSILEHPLRGDVQWQSIIFVWVGPEGLGLWECGGGGNCHRAGS